MVRAAYTFLSTEVLDIDDSPGAAPFPFVVGDPLFRRPKNQASLEVRYTQSRVTAFAIVNGRGEMLDLEPNFASSTYTSEGYAVMSAGATISITKTIRVSRESPTCSIAPTRTRSAIRRPASRRRRCPYCYRPLISDSGTGAGEHVIHDVSLALATRERAEVVGILGPNGSGKSTLLRLLSGALAPAGGTVTLENHDLRTMPRRTWPNRWRWFRRRRRSRSTTRCSRSC